jgi:hypothetical protein
METTTGERAISLAKKEAIGAHWSFHVPTPSPRAAWPHSHTPKTHREK